MYPTPYAYPNIYQNQLTQQIVKVHGRSGAEVYNMPPNSSVLLLDESEPIVYLAQTDGAGYKTITAYDIQAHQELPPVDTRSLEQRISRIEEMLNESNYTDTKPRKYEQDRSSKANGSNVQEHKQSSSSNQSYGKQ